VRRSRRAVAKAERTGPARAALPALLLSLALLLGACASGPGMRGIGYPNGPWTAQTLVTPGGARAPVEWDRVQAIYRLVFSQFETISCRRSVSGGASTRSRAPRPPRTGPRTAASTWNEWFEGHESPSSRVRYCTYGSELLNNPIPLANGRGPQDSTIHVVPLPRPDAGYPWEALAIQGDTARIGTPVPTHVAHSVYAFLHLMHRQGRLEAWIPGSADMDALALERAILERTADAWLLARAGYSADPDLRMDELVFARETGRLEALLLTRRPDDFPERREAWLRESPDGPEAYRAWFVETFDVRPGEEPTAPGAGRR
jgi:hypothetical protein